MIGVLLRQTRNDDAQIAHASYCISDSEGRIIDTHAPTAATVGESASGALLEQILTPQALSEQYECLIAPLFKLPLKLPASAWAGHVPFLFVLFKLLKPRTYVELGVHSGCSFIAACTAARSCCVTTNLVGVDTWEGDPHSGLYDGDTLYRELKTYVDGCFPNARLIRSSFSQARAQFNSTSIDVLNIDGYHTYEAVKEDFVTWFSAVSPQGVVLFHDIGVYDTNFGVHRLWAELKDRFTTIELPHSFGLGVLVLDPEDPRLAPLLDIARRPLAWRFYRNLVAEIAHCLPERVGYYDRRDRAIAERDAAIALLTRLFHSKTLGAFAPVAATWRRTKRAWRRMNVDRT